MIRLVTFLFFGILLSGCCNEDFIIPFEPTGPANDSRANALDITSLIDDPNCPSQDPIYTTFGSTPDGGLGSCWEDQRNAGDVWFKLTAQPPYGYLSVFIETGGTDGTQQSSQYVLWDADGVTEISCDGFNRSMEDIYDFNILDIGSVYYLSVSVPADSYKGTFSMCVTTSD